MLHSKLDAVPQSSQDDRPPSFIERRGSWLLAVCGLAAWGLGTWRIQYQAASAAFVTVGFILLLGAAFFSRVESIGRFGVVLGARKALSLVEAAPTDPNDAGEESRQRAVVYAARQIADNFGVARAEVRSTSRRQRAMRHDRDKTNLIAAVGNWLSRAKFATSITEDDDVRVGMVATRGSERLRLEFRPWIGLLGESEASKIVESMSAKCSDGEIGIVVINDDTVVSDVGLGALREAAIAVWEAQPYTAEVKTLAAGKLKGDVSPPFAKGYESSAS
jgi:hypothetical protein